MKFEGEAPHLCLEQVLSTLDLGELADFAAGKKQRCDFLQVSHFVMWGQRSRGENRLIQGHKESTVKNEICIYPGLPVYQAYDACVTSFLRTSLTE